MDKIFDNIITLCMLNFNYYMNIFQKSKLFYHTLFMAIYDYF
jgi:hypothetical protein